jgi:hypothetical protein
MTIMPHLATLTDTQAQQIQGGTNPDAFGQVKKEVLAGFGVEPGTLNANQFIRDGGIGGPFSDEKNVGQVVKQVNPSNT